MQLTENTMRKAFMITVINANAIAAVGVIIGAFRNGDVPNGLGVLVGCLLGAAFTGKSVQKISEVKNGKT